MSRTFCARAHVEDAVHTPELLDLIELSFDDEHVLRLKGPREPAQHFSDGQRGPRRAFPYTLSCSPAYLPRAQQSFADLVDVAELTDINRRLVKPVSEGIVASDATMLLDFFEARFCQILKIALDGFFYLGAIRPQHDYLSLEELPAADSDRIVQRRHVGSTGENSWRLERAFSGNRLREVSIKDFQSEDIAAYSDVILDHLGSTVDAARRQRILAAAPASLRDRVKMLAEPESTTFVVHSPGGVPNTSGKIEEVATVLAEFFNSVLDSSELFDRDIWERHFTETDDYTNILPDPEIRYLGEMGVANLDSKRLRRLNYLLVKDAFILDREGGYDVRLLATRDTYPLVSYVSAWLNRLAGAGLKPPMPCTPDTWEQEDRSPAHIWDFVPAEPVGFLLEPQSPSPFLEEPGDKLARLLHPCFGSSDRSLAQPPRQFSAGFHQLFPIVVQLGLMKAGELLAIENPEVHLHPGLQLELTGTFIKHVASGRHLILETHSDLVVRRVLRAILNEEDGLSQSQMGIYFADIRQEEHGYDNSTLAPLEINDQGQIANWPPGFLDDDVKESRRLLDAMYRRDEEYEEESDP